MGQQDSVHFSFISLYTNPLTKANLSRKYFKYSNKISDQIVYIIEIEIADESLKFTNTNMMFLGAFRLFYWSVVTTDSASTID